ncbi:SWIM zinc finger family protein [Phytohabitans sp. ZYX-F-186]|uniref:SWIM zinc finger family protein n=1 Tax=Phytohabitans maris TaxID=3071409 RepID=A0ABU0ZTD9_9ACTN|nr:SWIM zinc finger family protein [Phytohabitans sp. ZYX-F-186]MDQ7909737.1 SWIM zinc finger family protein [Phytohabitans sp. ZYX-F-186]
MAVRIDVEAFRESIPPGVEKAADRLREDDGIAELEPAGGGAQARVEASDGVFRPWVGIVDGALTGRCTCPGTDEDEDLCAHTAALVLAAVAGGINFSAAATPPDDEPIDTTRASYAEAARRLTHEQLADLVVAAALRDEPLGADLLSQAARLDP